MSGDTPQPLCINGWMIFAHPLFLEQVESLIAEVERLRAKNPTEFQKKNSTKRLAAIVRLAFELIPEDPTKSGYRQGSSLGEAHKHWFRAKFFQQYRLFFRYHQSSRTIVLAWVNDGESKRAYESPDDAYRVFRKMLESGHPPNDWNALLEEARTSSKRLRQIASR